MASIITSARTSTASVFDVIGDVAQVTSQLIGTATRSVDMLDAKVAVVHKQVIAEAKYNGHLADRKALSRAATEYVNLLEETHRANFPGVEFNRQEHLAAAIAELEALD